MSDDRPVLNQVNVVTRDMGASVAFYRRLGLEIPDQPAPWDAHHRNAVLPGRLDFDLDSAKFASQWDAGWPQERSGYVIGFSVRERETVDAIYRDLTGAGHEGQQPPWDAFWGARYAVVSDPDGNAVGIMSDIDPARRWDVADPSA